MPLSFKLVYENQKKSDNANYRIAGLKMEYYLNFLLLLVDYLPSAAFVWTDTTDSTI